MNDQPLIIATNKLEYATHIYCNICKQIKNKNEGHIKNRFICKICYNNRLCKKRVTNKSYNEYQKKYYINKILGIKPHETPQSMPNEIYPLNI
jgi:hypothetical protein